MKIDTKLRMLAIDPGTKCGYALNKPKQSGTWILKKSNRKESEGIRYLRLTNHLHELSKIDIVVYEEVRRHMGVDAAHIYGGIIATILQWCEENNIQYASVPVKVVKKLATGNGNAKKDAMIQACKNRLNYDPIDDNEADALWILEWAKIEFG